MPLILVNTMGFLHSFALGQAVQAGWEHLVRDPAKLARSSGWSLPCNVVVISTVCS